MNCNLTNKDRDDHKFCRSWTCEPCNSYKMKTCKYCEKELSEVKLESKHGCLDCAHDIRVEKIDHQAKRIAELETENRILRLDANILRDMLSVEADIEFMDEEDQLLLSRVEKRIKK